MNHTPRLFVQGGTPDNGIRLKCAMLVCLKMKQGTTSMSHEKMFVFWTKVGKLFQQTCQSTDSEWQKRRRVIDTRLLVVFILKMVLSRNLQGYGSSLGALWESCADKGIALPRTDAVAASSLCEARQKSPEAVFKTLYDELISLWHAHRDTPTWKGHRVFAIDGSKINAPRSLLEYGYKTPRETTRHYLCAMVSGLYNLQEQLILRFRAGTHKDERRCVPEHLAKLERGYLVIFDRGYFSYQILHQVLASGQHAVFRLQQGTTNSQVAAFWDSDRKDAIIDYVPSPAVKHGLKKRGPTTGFQPLAIRLVKCRIEDETHVYATTLMNQTGYPADCFADLYHGRWGIEELYKVSKQFIDVKDFHSQTERGVKHDISGHFLLINLARLFETDTRNRLPCDDQPVESNATTSWPQTGKTLKINFKHCLFVVGRHLENLVLMPGRTPANWLDKAMVAVARIRQRKRPRRQYPRRSSKPRTLWNSFGAPPKPLPNAIVRLHPLYASQCVVGQRGR